jgi:ketosteroid isomerase-like protein
MPSRKKTARKAARPAARKAAAGGASAMEALARRIVKGASAKSFDEIRDLYAPNCVSREPGPNEPARGHAGLEQKMKSWEGMTKSASWKARNVFIKGNTIGIEWTGSVTLVNGRTLSLEEVAIHEIKNGKIASERYYYDPGVIAGAMAQPASAPAPARPAAVAPPRPQAAVAAKPLPRPSTPAGGSAMRPASFNPPDADEDDDDVDDDDDDGSRPDPFDF